LILPPTEPLEHSHYDVAFYMLSVRNFARWSDPVFARAEGALHDHEIFSALTERLLKNAPLKRRLAARAKAWLGPDRLIDLGLRTGPHGIKRGLAGLSVARLRKQGHGVDLGPLEPRLPARLFTKSRRIEAAPRPFLDALTALEKSSDSEPGLVLIGRRDLRSNNSWMHNLPGLITGRIRCTAQIHPKDAAARKIEPGSMVRVRSRVGQVRLPAEITEAIMPGVVSIPHGWGHDREGVAIAVASQHAGASINDLTDDLRTDVITGAAAFSGTPVEIEPAE
jgi:anaerobic selenocysteine-containing dehydrogenase